jgi:hypothetical protein
MKDVGFLGRVSFLGVIASIVIVVMMVTDAGMVAVDSARSVPENRVTFEFSKTFEQIGLIAYSCALTITVPSLMKDMKEPKSLPKVSGIAHILIALLYTVICGAAWYAYAPDALASMSQVTDLENMASWIVVIITICITTNLFISTALFMNPPGNAFESLFNSEESFVMQIVTRSALMIPVIAIAFFCRDGDVMQALSGAVTTNISTLVVPHVSYIKLCKQTQKSNTLVFSFICIGYAALLVICGIIYDGGEFVNTFFSKE